MEGGGGEGQVGKEKGGEGFCHMLAGEECGCEEVGMDSVVQRGE